MGQPMGQPMGYAGQIQQQQQHGYPGLEVSAPFSMPVGPPASVPVGPPQGVPVHKAQDDVGGHVEVSDPLSK